MHGVRVCTLAREEQGLEVREIVLLEQLSVRVFLFDRAERGRSREKRLRLVFGDDAPECPSVRRADRLAFVDDGRRSVQQRPVGDVGMSHDPAHVGSGPPHVAGVDVIVVLHCPFERHHMAAGVADHALRLARRAGGVKNVKRVC